MIDVSTFQPADSRWGDIFTTLVNAGFDVYAPGTKVGECTAPYIVVKDEGTAQYNTFSSDVTQFAVMCYIPRGAYSTLERFVSKVRDAMKPLRPMVVYGGSITPSFYDDGVKAYMVSITYRNYRKID